MLTILLASPIIALAQEEGASADSFVNSLSLWLAVVVGVVASIMVLMNAQWMKGGAFGSALTYFGIGMFLVVGGFFAVVIPAWASEGVIMRVHDVMFIIGYVVMAIGARKIVRAAR